MISIETLTFNDFRENTFILVNEDKDCIIVDPGCYYDKEKKQIEQFIIINKLNPLKIINTHCHIDHLFGIRFLAERFDIPFYIHKDDEYLLQIAKEQSILFGLRIDQPPSPTAYLKDEDNFAFGENDLTIIHVPGHSKGSICIYSEKDKFIIAGDVLFNGSIGRTDLPGGNYETLVECIKSRLLILPEDTIVHPGHGPQTTIKNEKLTNPFLN